MLRTWFPCHPHLGPLAPRNQDGFCPDAPANVGLASADVVAITGCASDQTSADVQNVHAQFDLHAAGASWAVVGGGEAGARRVAPSPRPSWRPWRRRSP